VQAQSNPGGSQADLSSNGSEGAGIEVYRSIRAHELMLNQATSAYEHATVGPLIVINGGAAIAYLTLVGALSKSAQGLAVSAIYALAAVVLWGLGLVSAQFMVGFGLTEQRAWARRERLNRQRVEFHLLQTDAQLQQILIPHGVPDDHELAKLTAEAKRARARKSISRLVSLACFALGISFAAGSIV